jgi:transposase
MSRKSSRSRSTKAGPRPRGARSAPFRPTTPERFCAQYQDYTGLKVVHPHAAGIDIGGNLSHFVAVEIAPETLEVREFGCDTEDLYELRDYLKQHRVTTVALESTGVYWIPIYDILEAAGFEVYLVNPTQVKNVPGRRKDDKLDCRWLLTLHTFGLLSASFRPSQSMRPLRTIWRQRQQLVQWQADEIRRMQKCLDTMNLRVHKAISDLAGVTGRAIIQAIIQGERDPEVLASFRDPRCGCSKEELRRALTGHYLPDHIFLLKLAYERHQYFQQQIAACDAAIEPLLVSLIPLADDDVAAKIRAAGTRKAQTATAIRKHLPAYDLQTYLTLLLQGDATDQPGLGPLLVMDIITEVGLDIMKWPTEKHFASYVTCAPKHDISGGKILSRRTQKSQQRVAVAFRQAAAAVIRTDTALGAFYRRLAARIGAGKALVATARKIACQFYRFMRYGQAYADIGAAAYEERYRQQQLASLVKRAKALGYQVTPLAA